MNSLAQSNQSRGTGMGNGNDQNPRELLPSATEVKLEEAANDGGARGDEGREGEERKHNNNNKREGDQYVGSHGKGREAGPGQCGGIVNHLISNLLPGSGSSSAGEPQELKKQRGDDSCGLINQLISRLHMNPDDGTPAAGEASLLISIIED